MSRSARVSANGGKASHVNQLTERYGSLVDGYINDLLVASPELVQFYNMMRYQLGYVDRDFQPSQASGKGFRPFLCLLACEGVGSPPEVALPLATAIELLHNFSLIHDDIEDHDPSRRHRPTLWRLWGEPQAINAGDGMFAFASRILLTTKGQPHTILEVAQAFHKTALELTEGQYLDLSFEDRQEVTPQEYLQMIGLKTASIIRFSLWSGALCGGADHETSNRLADFGDEVGKAFQVWDDVMGIWGSPDITGKEAAKDLHNRKKTLPVLACMERAGTSDRHILQEFFLRRHDESEEVFRVLDATDARAFCEERIRHHLQRAFAGLETAKVSEKVGAELRALASEWAGQP